MPHGLIYEGVSPEPMAFSGGSAAQSSVLHAFDELLGICHRRDSGETAASPPPSERGAGEEASPSGSRSSGTQGRACARLILAESGGDQALSRSRSPKTTKKLEKKPHPKPKSWEQG